MLTNVWFMVKKEHSIDAIDRRIMQEMVTDSKRSYRKLAKALGMSPAAVIDRVRGLEGRGLITGYGARLDYSKLGFDFMAIVEVHISSRDLLTVEREMARLPNVAAVWDTTGEYDALAVLMCKTRADLSNTVKRMLNVKGVEKTNTNVVLNVVKKLTEFENV